MCAIARQLRTWHVSMHVLAVSQLMPPLLPWLYQASADKSSIARAGWQSRQSPCRARWGSITKVYVTPAAAAASSRPCLTSAWIVAPLVIATSPGFEMPRAEAPRAAGVTPRRAGDSDFLGPPAPSKRPRHVSTWHCFYPCLAMRCGLEAPRGSGGTAAPPGYPGTSREMLKRAECEPIHVVSSTWYRKGVMCGNTQPRMGFQCQRMSARPAPCWTTQPSVAPRTTA
jgi:hypothetical protein